MLSISPAGAALLALLRLAYWPRTVLPMSSSAYRVCSVTGLVGLSRASVLRMRWPALVVVVVV